MLTLALLPGVLGAYHSEFERSPELLEVARSFLEEMREARSFTLETANPRLQERTQTWYHTLDESDGPRSSQLQERSQREERSGSTPPACPSRCDSTSQKSVYCKACRANKNIDKFCWQHYNQNAVACLKMKVADSVCGLAGELTSLADGMQAEIAIDEDACYGMVSGYSGIQDLVDAIQDGVVDRDNIDGCWANIVGNNANFGAHQWDLGYFLSRAKTQLATALEDVFSAIDNHAGSNSGRRLESVRRLGLDGYSTNKAGTSSVVSLLATLETLDDCEDTLIDWGSGLEHAGMPCQAACDGSLGYCDYCGSGKCCKDGETDGACKGGEGGDGRYVCVPAYDG